MNRWSAWGFERPAVWVALVLLATVAGCAADVPTQVLVIVDSDIPADARPQTIHLSASLAGVQMVPLIGNVDQLGLPLSFALVHAGGQTGPLKIRVEGWRESHLVVTRDAELSFIEGKAVVLRMDLYLACAEMACGVHNTCTESGCISVTEAGARITDWRGNLGSLPAFRVDGGSFDAQEGAAAIDASARKEDGVAVDAVSSNDVRAPDPDAQGVPDASQPSLGTCGMFPGYSPWNLDVRAAPISPLSSTYLASMPQGTGVSIGFGTDTGVIWTSVNATQPSVDIELTKPNIRTAWPIPLDFPLAESLSYRLVIVDTGTCQLHEALGCQKIGRQFKCETGGKVALNEAWTRQPGSVLAQDSSLALLPGLLRVDEMITGSIEHALTMTLFSLQQGYVEPAINHLGGTATSTALPPMGIRMRLRADYPESTLGTGAKVVVKAMKKYGILITHTGPALQLMGERDARWVQHDLNGLSDLHVTDFVVLTHTDINL